MNDLIGAFLLWLAAVITYVELDHQQLMYQIVRQGGEPWERVEANHRLARGWNILQIVKIIRRFLAVIVFLTASAVVVTLNVSDLVAWYLLEISIVALLGIPWLLDYYCARRRKKAFQKQPVYNPK